jgi:hypothetical protein
MLMIPFGRHHPSALGIGVYYGAPVRPVRADEVLRVLCRRLAHFYRTWGQ